MALAVKTYNEFNPWDTRDEKRDVTPEGCPLTPTCTPWHAHGLPPIHNKQDFHKI